MLSDEVVRRLVVASVADDDVFDVFAFARAVAEAAVQEAREGAEPVGEVTGDERGYSDWLPAVRWLVAARDIPKGSRLYLHPPQASATVPGWKPIETLPGDSQTVLLSLWRGFGIRIGYKDADGKVWALYDDGENYGAVNRSEDVQHWMPMPAAPSRPGDEKEGR